MELKFWCAIVFALCSSVALAQKKLIVILVDGVRWNYVNDNLKGFKKMAENGVKAPYVVPVYPSVSYPNYHSIATGLYPESHGIVGNMMYDPDHKSNFSGILEPHSTDPFWWEAAEPVWITAEKAGHPAAVYWWPGCEVRINDTHPTICERTRYNDRTDEDKEDFMERFDDIMLMFKPSKNFPNGRLSLALMYYGSVDWTGHHFGTESSEVKKAMRDVDEIIDKLMSKIKKAGLQNKVNVMVVSDHGMSEIREDIKYVRLDKYAPYIKEQIDHGSFSMIIPLPGKLNTLFMEMSKDKIEGIDFYKKNDIPEKYHLKNNNRTPDLLVTAKKGYRIDKIADKDKPYDFPFGSHGYDPEEVTDMRTIFLGVGPSFRKGFTTKPLYNVDYYNIMCSILDIPRMPNNGSWERVHSMLKDGGDPTQHNLHYDPVVDSGVAPFGSSLYCVFAIIFAAFGISKLHISHY